MYQDGKTESHENDEKIKQTEDHVFPMTYGCEIGSADVIMLNFGANTKIHFPFNQVAI